MSKAKSAVMQPKFRMQVQKDRTKYRRTNKHVKPIFSESEESREEQLERLMLKHKVAFDYLAGR